MFTASTSFEQLMSWLLFLGLMPMLACVMSPPDVHPMFAGYNCSGEVAEGTVAHHVSGRLICCYPTTCNEGTIAFCTENKGKDRCVPCRRNGSQTCNYKKVTSHNSFHGVDHCTQPCTRNNAVLDVSLYPTSYTIKEGDNMTLQPTIYSDSALQGFVWSFISEGASINIASSLTQISNPEKYIVGKLQHPYLIVMNIEVSDNGTYQLYVGNENGSSIVKNVTLIVTAKPIVTMAKESDNVDAGNLYNVTCNIAGNPAPYTSGFLFKDLGGKERNITSDVSSEGVITYTINNASSSDSGYYTCRAQNSEGLGDSTMHLIVDMPPVIYSSYGGRVNKYDVGEKVTISVWVTSTLIIDDLFCKNEDQRSNMMVSSDPFNITNVGKSFNFSIKSIQPQDGGTYICNASNRLGTSSISVGIIVNVQSAPPTVQPVLDTANIDCEILTPVMIGFTVVSLFAVVILLVVHFKRRSCGIFKGKMNPSQIAILFVIAGFDIVFLVAAIFEACSLWLYIIFFTFWIISIAFIGWCCYSIIKEQNSNNKHSELQTLNGKQPDDQQPPDVQPLMNQQQGDDQQPPDEQQPVNNQQGDDDQPPPGVQPLMNQQQGDDQQPPDEQQPLMNQQQGHAQ